MKKIVFAAILMAFLMPAKESTAQRRHEERQRPRTEITEIVQNLTSSQKSKIESLTKESKERMDRLHKERKAVRDSIERYMDAEGDRSDVLFPLFDREAALQAEISREMYTTRLRIDEVLTDEQRTDMKKAHRRDMARRHKRDARPKSEK